VTPDERIDELEAVLARFLKPIRGVPFPVVIKALADVSVLPIDHESVSDRALIDKIASAAKAVGSAVRANPIRRNRPNEVGNDIEPFVIDALLTCDLRAERPRSAKGRGQQVGYPDILLYDREDRPTYLECKIFGEGTAMTTMRSFYLSPSANPQVCLHARHMLLAFGVDREPISDSRDSLYRPSSFKLIDLHNLKCDVKYEFNADNARLYSPDLLLAEGRV